MINNVKTDKKVTNRSNPWITHLKSEGVITKGCKNSFPKKGTEDYTRLRASYDLKKIQKNKENKE